MSLRDFPDLFKHLPQHKPWVITIGVISVVMVLAVCSFTSWQLLRDESTPIGEPTEGPGVVLRDISTRAADSTPLSVADVFPNPEVPAAEPDWPPYVLMGVPHISEDCSGAVDGEVRRLVVANGCSQVVRASFGSGDNMYFVTAGILNLPDATVAGTLFTSITSLIESGQGRFLGYISAPGVNDVLYRAPPHMAMVVRGHFLLYSVIVRQDGADLAPDEAEYVVYDLLKAYLRDTVIERWATVPEAVPTADATAPVDASPPPA